MAKKTLQRLKKHAQKTHARKDMKKKTFFYRFWEHLGIPRDPKNAPKINEKTFFFVYSFVAKSTSRRPEPQDPPRSDLWLILAHPSSTFPEKWGSHAEGVRHGTFADAHPPRDNLTFQEKCWKGVPKSSPELILGRFWHTLPQLFFSKKQVLTWRVCVRARSLTHTLRVRTSVFRKSAGRVCQNQPQASKKPLKTYMGAQSTKSRIYCFSYSRMVAAISRRVFRCFEKVVRSRPDRPTNAIAQPDRLSGASSVLCNRQKKNAKTQNF